MAKKERKSERIMIRLTKVEKENLEKILKIQNKKLAAVLRQFVDDYVNAYKILIDFNNKGAKNE